MESGYKDKHNVLRSKFGLCQRMAINNETNVTTGWNYLHDDCHDILLDGIFRTGLARAQNGR